MLKGNEIIYQIFVRNYSKDGTFNKVNEDLNRIKDLGIDIIYLMPIHEIGILNRKGTYGSPYAIRDYYSISSDLGTKDDLINLINNAHKLKMKIILDMVFNHTSPDNILMSSHPEYYFYKNNKPGNRVGEWTDIVDLDTFREDTQKYLINVLKYYVSLGIDGFRFDVASMISFEFFKKARKELGKEIIFIGESIGHNFVEYLKSVNIISTKDEDMFPTFDALYNYNWYFSLKNYLLKEKPIDELIAALNEDEKLLFNKGIRVNCLENHDNERISHYLNNEKLDNIINFLGYIKGLMFIYMGQEYGINHKPELFEKDPVNWIKNEKILNKYKEVIKNKKNENNSLKVHLTFKKINENTIEVIKELDNKIIDRKSFCF